MSRLPIARVGLVLALGAAVFAVSACDSDSTDNFTVRQAVPQITEFGVDGRTGGKEYVLAFEAGLTRDREPAGELVGLLTTVDPPEPAKGGSEILETRFANLYFDFSSTDSIVVSGATVYPANQAEMEAGRPQLRAVTGGTGEYAGASGQVTTTRREDGTYSHAFELTD